LQKGQTPEKGFALFKNDITTAELTSEIKIHSRYQWSWIEDFKVLFYRFYGLTFSRLKAEVKYENGIGL